MSMERGTKVFVGGVMRDIDVIVGQRLEGLQEIVGEHAMSHVDLGGILVRSTRCKDRIAFGLHEEAYEVACTAMQLMSLSAPQFLEHADKQYLVARFAGLAADSAAVALAASKDVFQALHLLELGRGIIAGSINEMRMDVSTLLNRHPQLGQQFVYLRKILDSSGLPETTISMGLVNGQLNERYEAWTNMEELLSNIRGQTGFEDFLQAPARERVQSAATDGPLVITNVSQYRYDAIVIEENGICLVTLAGLSISDIRKRVQKGDFG